MNSRRRTGGLSRHPFRHLVVFVLYARMTIDGKLGVPSGASRGDRFVEHDTGSAVLALHKRVSVPAYAETARSVFLAHFVSSPNAGRATPDSRVTRRNYSPAASSKLVPACSFRYLLEVWPFRRAPIVGHNNTATVEQPRLDSASNVFAPNHPASARSTAVSENVHSQLGLTNFEKICQSERSRATLGTN